ncbi:MAG: rhamnogalacturonan lyase [Polyangiaceae bacterium]
METSSRPKAVTRIRRISAFAPSLLGASLLFAIGCGSSGSNPGAGGSGANAGNPVGSAGVGTGGGGAAPGAAGNGGGGAPIPGGAGGNDAMGGNGTTGGSAGVAGTSGTSGASGGASGGASDGASGGGNQPASCTPPTTTGHYQMEDLDRGVVAVKVAGGVYVGWRMMGYEYDKTATNVAYNLYRDGTKLATVTDSTNYLDTAGTATSSYAVSAVIKGAECAKSEAATSLPGAQNYLSIPLTPPANGPNGGSYSANDASTGDLDGDGKLDIVLKWDPSNSQDNSKAGVTDDVFLDGYTLAGKRLWRIDLGPNIRAGAHYTQFSVGDFDGDGKAEVACKTSAGTKDGTGAFLSKGPAATDTDSMAYRNSDGYVLSGPEYLTVFEGATGKELATINFLVPRGTVSSWGDAYGNRVDRFNGGMAFVSDTGSGKASTGKPSIIQGRGYYTRLTVSAYNWRSATLSKNWVYDSVTSLNSSGAGAHSEMAADTNGDGAQEIITGATTIGSDGSLQCQTGLGHGDAIHVGELIVGKGITVFTVHEDQGGYDVHDAATCKTSVKVTGGDDNGRGVADYIQPSNTTGAAFWSASAPDLYSIDGTSIGSKPASTNFLAYWDADESRELEDGTKVTKYGGGTLVQCTDCASNNGTKATPTLTADLFGDWREEVIWRQADNKALRIYTTTDVTKRRIYTLMHDPVYRSQVSFEQSAYNQPPHVGFHIGAGMADPPVPDIRIVMR